MKRSFIIYTYNSQKYIGNLIDSLMEQIQDNEQIVIVDDMSEDNTVPIIVEKIGYFFTDEDHYKLYINSTKKGKKDSVAMAKKIATGDFKFIINKKGRIKVWYN